MDATTSIVTTTTTEDAELAALSTVSDAAGQPIAPMPTDDEIAQVIEMFDSQEFAPTSEFAPTPDEADEAFGLFPVEPFLAA